MNGSPAKVSSRRLQLNRRGQFRADEQSAAVVKGGGHSYQGTSSAADSLLIWTRHMNAVVLHDAFLGASCEGKAEPQPAVSIEPGAIWGHV
jgi:FAD/FMN-containing dehydrogenase